MRKTSRDIWKKKTFHHDSTHPLEHPNKKWREKTTAAGGDQILLGTWLEAMDRGFIQNFSPHSQDIISRHKLSKPHVFADVEKGVIDTSISILRDEWS